MDKRHLLNTTAYSSVCSPCGKYLAVANNFGYISIFHLEKALTSNSEKWKKSIFTFKAHKGTIHSLVSTRKCLISGGLGPISAWRWSDILERNPAIAWVLKEPSQGSEGSFLSNDVNVLACDEKKVYAGRDDNLVCVWDLLSKKCEQKLSGHSSYIHDVALMPDSHGLISSSEDGCVKVWDLRTSQATQTFEPHMSKDLSRPEYGKWVSCVAVDDNGQWMVCGGGPEMSLWHLRSQSRAAVLGCPEFTPYSVKFNDNTIVAGGNGHAIHHWYTNGEKKTSVPCTVGTVFSLTFDKNRGSARSPLIAAGTGYKLDVFCDLNYRSHMLML